MQMKQKKLVGWYLPEIPAVNFCNKETIITDFQPTTVLLSTQQAIDNTNIHPGLGPENSVNNQQSMIISQEIDKQSIKPLISNTKTWWTAFIAGTISSSLVCILVFSVFFMYSNNNQEVIIKQGTATVINNTIEGNLAVEEEVVDAISSAVVTVLTHDVFGISGSGSGVIYRTDSSGVYIVTNAHVVLDSRRISIFRNDLGETAAEYTRLIAMDEQQDIAVLVIEQPQHDYSTIVEFADSDQVKIGQRVLAIGSPYGSVFSGSVTSGIISGKEREVPIDDEGNTQLYLQTDAAINGGNSGGALVNMQGQLIGINSAKMTESENIGLAIPANQVIETLKEKGAPLPTNVEN